MTNGLTPAPASNLPARAVDLSPQYPTSGTMIHIEKGDIFKGAAEEPCTKDQTAILCAPLDPREVRILPDTASLYLPWSWYANRLTKAFGPAGWSLLPIADERNNPKEPLCRDNVMYREYVLKADKRFIASALGECGYNPNNKRMTFGDTVEGARSNALSRCCKGLGMAPELYNEDFREKWVEEYAVCVWAVSYSGKKDQLWRRKTALPMKGEQSHANPPCPCEACKSGKPTAAKDGKPMMRPPEKTQDAEFTETKLAPEGEAPQGYEVIDVKETQDGAKKIYWDIKVKGAEGVIAGFTRDPEEVSVATSAKRTGTRVLLTISVKGKWTEFKGFEPIIEGGTDGQ